MRKTYPKYFYIILLILATLFIVTPIALYSGYISIKAKNRLNQRIEIKGDLPIRGDETVGFVAAKNASTFRHHKKTGLAFHLYTDSRGARVNSSGQQSPPKVDILTVGGSYSWGHGIENENTYTEILGSTFDVPVANFSFGSYGTAQALQLLELNSDLEPKVVIYGFIGAHLQRNVSPCAPSYAPYCLAVSYVARDESGSPRLMAPVEQYTSRRGEEYFQYLARDSVGLDDLKWGARILLSRIKREYVWQSTSDRDFRHEAMDYLMTRMWEATESIDALLVVVHIPSLQREKTPSAPRFLMEWQNRGIVFLDMAEVIRDHYADPSSPLLHFERDEHPNELAHKLVAEKVSEILRAREVF